MASENTAIWRNKLSAPARWLHENGKLKGRILDYGCGHGDLQKFLDPNIDQWDPYWTPETDHETLIGQYDTVVLLYVLNVVSPDSCDSVIEQATRCLRPGGILYIAVRRDIKKEGPTSRGKQYSVELDFSKAFERKGQFCIYCVRPA